MAEKGFKNNLELYDLVRSCMKRRLSYKEAILELKEFGFVISGKTYQRIKNEIDNSKRARLEHLATEELLDYDVNSIDTSIAVESELWNIVRNSKNSWERMKALEMILKCCRERKEYYESSSVIAQLSKKLDTANQTKEGEHTTKASDEKASDEKASDEKASDEKASDEKASDEKDVEEQKNDLEEDKESNPT